MNTQSSSQERFGYSRLGMWLPMLFVALCIGGICFSANVLAAQPTPSADRVDKDVRNVDCGSSNPKINSISATLASLDPLEDNTIYVSAACTENVSINGFEHLRLIAQNSASITSVLNGHDVIHINESHVFLIQGFTINGVPNAAGISCAAMSKCGLSGNTVQGAGNGIVVRNGSIGFLNNSILENNGRGLLIAGGSHATSDGDVVQNNSGPAAVVLQGDASLGASNLTVKNNGGPGIVVRYHSDLGLDSSTITGNGTFGVWLQNTSSASFSANNTITGNGAGGVFLQDLSFASFDSERILGNDVNHYGFIDVTCGQQFSSARGAQTNIGGGLTDCSN